MKYPAGAISALILLAHPAAADTLLHAGRMIDGIAGQPADEVTIRIRDGVIAGISPGFAAPLAEDAVIDLRGQTVLPGLMDMHVHLTGEYSPNDRLEQFTLGEADLAIDAVRHARRTLESGFTVVRNLGDSFNVTVALRNAINAGEVPGPLIFTAAKGIGTTGGHADPTKV